jgi:hypothetical protein
MEVARRRDVGVFVDGQTRWWILEAELKATTVTN